MGVNVLLVVRDAVFWDVGRDFLRIRQRAHPLVVVGLLRGRVFFYLQEHVLSRKRHSAGKSPVARLIVRMSRPPNKRLLWPAPAKETPSTHGRQFDVRDRRNLFSCGLVPSSRLALLCTIHHPSNPRRLGTFCGG